MPKTADEFLDSIVPLPDGTADPTISPLLSAGDKNLAVLQSNKTSKKDYRDTYRFINVTSSSQRRELKCARKFQIMKTPATTAGSGLGFVNIDFVFGHSVGAGVQTYLVTGSKDAAIFAGMLAWNTDLDAVHEKKSKSAFFATLAIEKFVHWWHENMAAHWEVALFNGKPASELTFFIDTQNGYYHAGHIDIVLRHKTTGRYMVLELKTTAIRTVDEAQYGNSEQPLGYSIILDKIAAELEATSTFEVLYLVYSSTNREWTPFPFTKNRSQRMEWLQALLIDHTLIGTYRKLEFFPKNGEACWSFSSRCDHYGICDLKSTQRTDFAELVVNEDRSNLPEDVDFFFTLEELTAASIRGATRVQEEHSVPVS